MNIIDRVNAAPLDPDLLRGALEMMAELDAAERRDFEDRTFAIVKFVAERADEMTDQERSTACVAIGFRLEALARLMLIEGARGWRLPGAEEGQDWIHDDVVRCACEEPLISSEREVSFDSDSFHRRLLGMTTPAGCA